MSEALTIAYLTSQYGRPGDTWIRAEVEALRRRGHTVHTFSIRRPDAGNVADGAIDAAQATTDYILAHSLWALAVAFVWALIRKPKGVLRSFALARRTRPPGLVAAFKQCAYLVEATYLARELCRRNVSHLHDHIAESSATVAMLASEVARIPFSMTVHGPGIFFHPRRWALGTKIARSAFTACISDFCRSQCMIFAPPETWDRLHVVRCAVPERLAQVEPSPIPDAPRFVSVGRLCPEKGFRVLIEAVGELVRELPDLDLSIVGDGPDRDALAALVRQRGLEHVVSLAGWLDSDGVAEAIVRSRALVAPSFAEGLPVVVIEAFALHRPVIATQVMAVPELVRDGQTGWLVQPGDATDLANAIRDAATAPQERMKALADAGYDRVVTRHSLEGQVGRLEALIRRAATSVGTGRRESP